MKTKYPPTHRPLQPNYQSQLQAMHHMFPLAWLHGGLQTNPYTIARAKAGAPLLLSSAVSLEQNIEKFFSARAAA
jgi:hypothetical protein